MKPPSKHFEFSQKWAIFGRLEKKSFQKWLEPNTFSVCYPNTLLYIVFDHTLAENAAILVKIRNFPFLKNPQFWLFSEVLEVKLKFQDKFYNVIDYNKCPSSEKEDEKCFFGKSYFHQIQPNYGLLDPHLIRTYNLIAFVTGRPPHISTVLLYNIFLHFSHCSSSVPVNMEIFKV